MITSICDKCLRDDCDIFQYTIIINKRNIKETHYPKPYLFTYSDSSSLLNPSEYNNSIDLCQKCFENFIPQLKSILKP